jgi:hypothetical protein
VEKIAQSQELEGELNLEPLSNAVAAAVEASTALDVHTTKVMKRLGALLPERPKHRQGHRPHSPVEMETSEKPIRRSQNENESAPSLNSTEPSAPSLVMGPPTDLRKDKAPRPSELKHMKEIKRLLEEIRLINKKKQGFEGGFITEEGIKVSHIRALRNVRSAHVCRSVNGTSTRVSLRDYGLAMARPL